MEFATPATQSWVAEVGLLAVAQTFLVVTVAAAAAATAAAGAAAAVLAAV